MIQCSICKRNPLDDNITVYRIGDKGDVNAEWRCSVHMPPDFKIDPEVKEICEIIEEETY